MEPTINAITSGQHALITLDQARAEAMTARAARHQIDMGRWVRSHVGVYRVAGAPASWRQDLMAACLAAGDGAMASHRSAARLWGLIGEELLEVSMPRPGCHRLAGVVVHRSTDLHTTRALHCDGIPVTPPARTLVDLGAVVHQRVVEWALGVALGRQLVTADDLRSTLDAVGRKGRRGAGVLRRLLESTSDGELGSESVLEARMWRVCRDHGLPAPVGQHEVRAGRRFVGRVDFAYPDVRLAIEVDGYESHSSLGAFRQDRARQNELVAAGWTVLRFTWHDVTRQPERVATSITRVLGALDPHVPGALGDARGP